jgi:hypothetical protein
LSERPTQSRERREGLRAYLPFAMHLSVEVRNPAQGPRGVSEAEIALAHLSTGCERHRIFALLKRDCGFRQPTSSLAKRGSMPSVSAPQIWQPT